MCCREDRDFGPWDQSEQAAGIVVGFDLDSGACARAVRVPGPAEPSTGMVVRVDLELGAWSARGK